MAKSGAEQSGAVARGAVAEARRVAVVEAVFAGMAEGRTLAETVEAVGADRGERVTPGVVRRWIAGREDWLGEYRRLKPLVGQALAEEAVAVARAATRHSAAEDRLLIETLRWMASKVAPAEFGERAVVEHQGQQELRVRVVEVGGDGEERPSAVPGLQAAVDSAVSQQVSQGIPRALPRSENGNGADATGEG